MRGWGGIGWLNNFQLLHQQELVQIKSVSDIFSWTHDQALGFIADSDPAMFAGAVIYSRLKTVEISHNTNVTLLSQNTSPTKVYITLLYMVFQQKHD